jgi:hypothetical protein
VLGGAVERACAAQHARMSIFALCSSSRPHRMISKPKLTVADGMNVVRQHVLAVEMQM